MMRFPFFFFVSDNIFFYVSCYVPYLFNTLPVGGGGDGPEYNTFKGFHPGQQVLTTQCHKKDVCLSLPPIAAYLALRHYGFLYNVMFIYTMSRGGTMDGNGCISRSSILALLLRSSVYALITHRTHCSSVHCIFLKTQVTSNKMVFRQKAICLSVSHALSFVLL